MQTKHICDLIHIWTKGEVGASWNRFKPFSKIFLLTVPMRYYFCGSFVLFMPCVYHAFASVHCCLVITWRERADPSALVCGVYCDFATYGLIWYLFVSIPDPCFLSYLEWLVYEFLSQDRLTWMIMQFDKTGVSWGQIFRFPIKCFIWSFLWV